MKPSADSLQVQFKIPGVKETYSDTIELPTIN